MFCFFLFFPLACCENIFSLIQDIIEEVTSCHDNDEYDKIVQDVCNYYNKIVSLLYYYRFVLCCDILQWHF